MKRSVTVEDCRTTRLEYVEKCKLPTIRKNPNLHGRSWMPTETIFCLNQPWIEIHLTRVNNATLMRSLSTSSLLVRERTIAAAATAASVAYQPPIAHTKSNFQRQQATVVQKSHSPHLAAAASERIPSSFCP